MHNNARIMRCQLFPEVHYPLPEHASTSCGLRHQQPASQFAEKSWAATKDHMCAAYWAHCFRFPKAYGQRGLNARSRMPLWLLWMIWMVHLCSQDQPSEQSAAYIGPGERLRQGLQVHPCLDYTLMDYTLMDYLWMDYKDSWTTPNWTTYDVWTTAVWTTPQIDYTVIGTTSV